MVVGKLATAVASLLDFASALNAFSQVFQPSPYTTVRLCTTLAKGVPSGKDVA
jgi:hypothetical protein